MEKKGGDTHLDEDNVLRKERHFRKGGRRNWKRRWFILYSDGALAYFDNAAPVEKGRLQLVRDNGSGDERLGCSWHVRDEAPDEILLALPPPPAGGAGRRAMLLRHADMEELAAWIRTTADAFGATVQPLLFDKEERGTAERAMLRLKEEVSAAVSTLHDGIEDALAGVTVSVGSHSYELGPQQSPGSPAGQALPEYTAEQWIEVTLAEHNASRAKHGLAALAWSEECKDCAEEQAESCQVEGRLEHGNYEGASGRHGQNAFYSSVPPTIGQAVDAWYREISQYDFGRPGLSARTGHFTQVVWRATTHVGMARSSNGKYVVANYLPPGNSTAGGAFAANVPYPL